MSLQSVCRQSTASESALWMLADLRANLLGADIPKKLDVRIFRNRMRDLLQHLPLSPSLGDVKITSHVVPECVMVAVKTFCNTAQHL
jgi:hypothetical protein